MDNAEPTFQLFQWKNYEFLDKIYLNDQNMNIYVGETYELRSSRVERTGDFIGIAQIIRNLDTYQVCVIGPIFVENQYLDGICPPAPLNVTEVTMVANVLKEDKRPFSLRAMHRISADQISSNRSVLFTDSSFDFQGNQIAALVFSSAQGSSNPWINPYLPGVAPVSCRRVLVQVFQNRGAYSKYVGSKLPPTGGVLRLLRREDIITVSSAEIGSDSSLVTENSQFSPPDSIENQTDASYKPYTFADICHGMGGASLAAKLAGFHIEFAIDKDPLRHETYKSNFPGVDTILGDMTDLTNFDNRRADHLHFSPMCNVYSTACVHTPKNAEEARKTLRVVPQIVEKISPRHLTVEQVPGLSRLSKHEEDFKSLVRGLSVIGYNVCWDLFALKYYSLPSMRTRLLVSASKEGEHIPRYPHPECGLPGLSQSITAWDILGPHVPIDNTERVEIPNCLAKFRKPRPSGILPTFTRSLKTYIHPSGDRLLYTREAACLQGFPMDFMLPQRRALSFGQIGDSVPPKAFAPFLKEIIKSMEGIDGEEVAPTRSPYALPILDWGNVPWDEMFLKRKPRVRKTRQTSGQGRMDRRNRFSNLLRMLNGTGSARVEGLGDYDDSDSEEGSQVEEVDQDEEEPSDEDRHGELQGQLEEEDLMEEQDRDAEEGGAGENERAAEQHLSNQQPEEESMSMQREQTSSSNDMFVDQRRSFDTWSLDIDEDTEEDQTGGESESDVVDDSAEYPIDDFGDWDNYGEPMEFD